MRACACILTLGLAVSLGPAAAAESGLPCRVPELRPGALPPPVPIPENCDVLQSSADAAHFAPSPSRWFESEKTAYAQLLSHAHAKVLVVPFQVEGAAFDRVERMLMTARLARYLARESQQQVADPFLIERALGEGMRRVGMAEAERLAVQLGAERMVIGFTGHDGRGNMRLRFAVYPIGKRGIDRQQPAIEKRYAEMPFGDGLPSELFRKMLPEVARDLGFPQRLAAAPRAYPTEAAASLPDSPASLAHANANASPIARAYQLQLLGALYPSESVRGIERPFMRSLLLLDDVAPESPDYRLLKARAWMYLRRRPAALAMLGQPQTVEERALQAMLNGNLPDLEQEYPRIRSRADKLMSLIDLLNMRAVYDAFDGRKARAELAALAGRSREWQTLLAWKYIDWDGWSRRSNIELKTLLDRSFPVPGLTAESMLHEQVALGNDGAGSPDIELSVFRHARKLIADKPTEWCCEDPLVLPSRWDYLDLLVERAESNLETQVRFLLQTQGLPERADALLARYEIVYADHSALTLLRAETSAALAVRRQGPEADALRKQASELRAKGIYWAQGQSARAARAWRTGHEQSLQAQSGASQPVDVADAIVKAYAVDYPARQYWPVWMPGAASSVLRAQAMQRLAYSLDWFGAVTQASGYAGTPDAQQQLLKEIEGRFKGAPERPNFLALRQPGASGSVDKLSMYRDAIRANPRAWENYLRAGKAAIEKGDYAQASKLFLSYPGFSERHPDETVGLSNSAYEAGSELYWRGAIREATPLYRLAAGFDNGSDASITSGLRLKLLAGDYVGAADDSLQRARRYNSAQAYSDLFALLHVLGHSKEAWPGFDALMERFEDPQLWASAYVGHRVSAASDSQVESWLMSERIRKASANGYRFAPNFAVLWYVVDRPPRAGFGDLVETLDSPARHYTTSRGFTVEGDSAHPGPAEQAKIVGPSHGIPRPAAESSAGAVPGTAIKYKPTPVGPVRSDLAYFADAYTLLRTKDYSGATRVFDEMTRYYEIVGTYALPYFTWGLAKSGDARAEELYKTLDRQTGVTGPFAFDTLLAKAFIAGAAGRHTDAVQHLKDAFNRWPYAVARPIYTVYQFAQACEWLYEDSGKDEYRVLALDWAREVQRIAPMYSWAYAMEAKLTRSPEQRLRSLALTLYLDPNSERIAKFPAAEKKRAKEWLKTNNPFLKTLSRTPESRV